MPCCKKPEPPAIPTAAARHRVLRRRLLVGVVTFAILAALPGQSFAEGENAPPPTAEAPAKFARSHIRWTPEGYVVDSNVDVTFSPHLRDALTRGIPMFFILEVRIEAPRWYWWNKVVTRHALHYRLAYHTITRNWRLTIGSVVRNFDTLDDAIAAMLNIRNWHVLAADALEPGSEYIAWLRFRHDTGQLPALFQLDDLANADWQLDTQWIPLEFTTPAITAEKTAVPPPPVHPADSSSVDALPSTTGGTPQ